MAIKLGATVKDSVTGLTGVATARNENLHSATVIRVEPGLHDGKPVEPQWVEESRLKSAEEADDDSGLPVRVWFLDGRPPLTVGDAGYIDTDDGNCLRVLGSDEAVLAAFPYEVLAGAAFEEFLIEADKAAKPPEA